MFDKLKTFLVTAALAVDLVDKVSEIIKLESNEQLSAQSAYYKIKELYQQRNFQVLVDEISSQDKDV